MFTEKSYLAVHMKSQHFPETFTCKLCDFETKAALNLSIHVKKTHNLQRTTCTECNKTVKDISRHKRAMHSGDQIEYECKICSFKTYIKDYLRSHVKTVHKKKAMQCKECNSVVKDMAQHMKRKHK